MKSTKHPASSSLILLITPSEVVLLRTRDAALTEFARVPVATEGPSSHLTRVVRDTVAAMRPRQVFVSWVGEGHRRSEALIELLDEERASLGFAIVWIPEVVRLATCVAVPEAASEVSHS